jgi:acyl-CoA reductase-like NAD-dependent aldehyde dehydrogenase
VTPSMRLAREEVFGPILSVFKWSDEDVMFDAVNAVDYGLTASIWTRDLVTAHRAARRVEAGTSGSTMLAPISMAPLSAATSSRASAARRASTSCSSSRR